MRKKRDRRERGRRHLAAAAVVAGALSAAWALGLLRFADLVPSDVADGATRTDGIVVLTGGSRRLGAGLDLLSKGMADKLFVSGVYQGVDVRQLLQIVRRGPGELENRIAIGNATNTRHNAIETTQWARQQDTRSLRLVTAAYHMPRSLLEFRFAMPDVVLVPHPVFPEHVKQDRWWAWPGTASLMISEYNKYLLAWARHWAGRVLPRAEDGKGGGAGER